MKANKLSPVTVHSANLDLPTLTGPENRFKVNI